MTTHPYTHNNSEIHSGEQLIAILNPQMDEAARKVIADFICEACNAYRGLGDPSGAQLTHLIKRQREEGGRTR